MTNEYAFLASEITMLEDLLISVPEANIIERLSLEARLRNVRCALTELTKETEQKPKIN